ncbi:MAG: lysophospholipid acyltransferase family protein [Phycisphaerales bacterium]|nr:lysophospholipid acyltransferase family protein [Phycisphaerales bacterium]
MAASIRHLAEYAALRTVAGVLQCFDVDQNLHSAAAFGSLYARLGVARRQRAEANIAASMPNLSSADVRRIADRSIRHMFQVFAVDSLVMPRLISVDSWPTYVELGSIGPGLDLLLHDRPAIFITGHVGNWEVLGMVLATIGLRLAAIARPLDNPLINDWLLSLREARGLQVVTKWGATPVLQEILESGGRVAFIADQNAGDDGLFVPFFGRLASSYKSIGLLAMRHEVPVVCGYAAREDERFRFRLECTDIIHPEDWADQPDPLFYITARYNRAMEQMVRDVPEQYLWVHRRWKSRPRHEREGRPFPASLRRRLESLPWLSGDDVERIVAG